MELGEGTAQRASGGNKHDLLRGRQEGPVTESFEAFRIYYESDGRVSRRDMSRTDLYFKMDPWSKFFKSSGTKSLEKM